MRAKKNFVRYNIFIRRFEMAEQENLKPQPQQPKPSPKKKEKEPLSPVLKKAYTTWGIVTVVVSFTMFFASIITFVLVLLRLKVPFILGVVFFVAGLASGATGIPLLHATAREKAEQAKLNQPSQPLNKEESQETESNPLTKKKDKKAKKAEKKAKKEKTTEPKQE